MQADLRLWGDPFTAAGQGPALRAFLDHAAGRGVDCALDLAAARGEDGGRPVPLEAGRRSFTVRTAIPGADLAAVTAAGRRAAPAAAPVVVFGDDDAVATAALAWPRARAVIAAGGRGPGALWPVVEAALAGAVEDPSPCLDRDHLDRLLTLPVPDPGAPLLVVGAVPGDADWAAGAVFDDDPDDGALAAARAVVVPAAGREHLGLLLRVLASGRPLVAARWAATATVLSAPGIAWPIGGDPGGDGGFVPHPGALRAAVAALAEDPEEVAVRAGRARHHVVTHHRAASPRTPRCVPRPGGRPRVVLEAPLLDGGSAAELTLETAAALLRRGNVDVGLVPCTPFRGDLAAFRRRAPELEPLLTRRPGRPDLWLSAGWPPRPDRPDCGRWMVRLDWEYGSLPVELTPVVRSEADGIVVHSIAVLRAVTAAGRNADEVALVPHGAGPAFHPGAAPHPGVRAFAGDRLALLFVGGLIWRKGLDLFLRTLLELRSRGAPVCGVIKAVGGTSHYAGYELGDLVRRCREALGPGGLLVLDEELDREALAGVFAACDLLVHPYRGEGFGLPVLEAMCCGLPVVVTRGGATDDFCRTEACIPVPAKRRLLELPGAHVGTPWVLEPDPGELLDRVASALAALDDLRAAAHRVAPELRRLLSWERSAAAVEELAAAATGCRTMATPRGARPPVAEPV